MITGMLERDGFAIVPDVLDAAATQMLVSDLQNAIKTKKRQHALRDLLSIVPAIGSLVESPPSQVLEKMLTLRVHLYESSPDNGPLRVLPGTHRLGRLCDHDVDRLRTDIEEHVCLVPRGGALLMRPLLLHASSTAQKPSHRRVIHLEFAAEPLPGGLEWRAPRPRSRTA